MSSFRLECSNSEEIQDDIQARIALWINKAWQGLRNTGDAPPHFLLARGA